MGLIGFGASLVLMCTVKFVGKRRLYIISIAGSCISCFFVGVYGYIYLPAGRHSTGNNTNLNFTGDHSYFVLFAFFALAFFSSLGIWNIIWMIMSEVFPVK